jgi:hypothetical protein
MPLSCRYLTAAAARRLIAIVAAMTHLSATIIVAGTRE